MAKVENVLGLRFGNTASLPAASKAPNEFRISSGILYFSDGSSWIVVGALENDTTPQLGGNLDINGHSISDETDGIITLNDATVIVGTVYPSGISVSDGSSVLSRSSSPAATIKRTSTDTNQVQYPLSLIHDSSADMVDDFGIGLLARINDSANVDNSIGSLRWKRAGADNTGKLELCVFVAGVETLVATFNGDGTTGDFTITESQIADLQTYLKSADIDTLAELNAILSDATLIDTTDSRLSDARTPTTHTHPASEISDASANGRSLITAADYAAMRTLLNVEDGATADQTASEILSALLGVDGAGSGLDADLLDGNQAAAFATAAQGALADSALQSSDIGVSVQGYDVDTTKNDVANTFTQNQTIETSNNTMSINGTGAGNQIVFQLLSKASGQAYNNDRFGFFFRPHNGDIVQSIYDASVPAFREYANINYVNGTFTVQSFYSPRFGGNTKIGATSAPSYTLDVNGDARATTRLITGSFTVATLPSVVAGGIIYVSDETGGATLAFSDGTNWRRVTDLAIVA